MGRVRHTLDVLIPLSMHFQAGEELIECWFLPAHSHVINEWRRLVVVVLLCTFFARG